MSSVWGQMACKFETANTTVELQNVVLSPSFFINAEIMHESINGKRTWSKDEHFAEFTIRDILKNYTDPKVKANEIEALEHKAAVFTPFNMLWSKNVIITNVWFDMLTSNNDYAVAVIEMVAADSGTLGSYLIKRTGERFLTRDGKFIRKKIRGIQ
ncbi:MAG: hypothetical protein HYS25_13845 [Ignavibacteriales bacterium]|nr:hypothetical protein [Ignavibacteriales bacterium]